MSQTSVSIPPSQRYSLYSPGLSSLASSPVSAYQPPSIFDVVDQSEISRPSSPESFAFASPKRGSRRSRISDASIRSFSMPAGFQGALPPAEQDEPHDVPEEPETIPTAPTGDDLRLHPAIPEEQEDTTAAEQENTEDTEVQHETPALEQDEPGPDIAEVTFEPMQYRSLRKSSSHESLLSVSGMDIHTLRERPSQLLVAMNSQYFYQRPRRVVSTGTELSSTPPVISTMNITADKSSMAPTRKTSHSLLATVAAKNMPATTSSTSSESTSAPSSKPVPITGKASTIGRKVGGWVRGRWGVTPSASVDDLRQNDSAAETSSLSSESTLTSTAAKSSDASISSDAAKPVSVKPRNAMPILMMRASGINQKGPIPGFFPAAPAPVSIHANVLDQQLLEESLRE